MTRPALSRPPRDYDRDPARMQIPVEAGSIDIGLLMYWALHSQVVRANAHGQVFDASPEALSPTRAAELLRDELGAELRAVLGKARDAYDQHADMDPRGAADLARTAARLAYAWFGEPTRRPGTGTPEAAPEAVAVGTGR